MKSKYSNKVFTIATVLILGLTASASAQDNPLLQPVESNPLLQQNTSAESAFEAQARAIDAAATKDSNDPVCQNIRVNYDQQMAEIMSKVKNSNGAPLSQLGQFSGNSQNALSRANRINRNITGSSSGVLGKASGSAYRGTAIANDAAALGGVLGLGGGKKSQKKAAKKAAKLDVQAMDAVKQTGCPMSTFN